MIASWIDYCDREGAIQLANEITAYWHDRGHNQVEVQVIPLIDPRGSYWCIRSNLLRGLPP
jgi:hypothetical protein